VIIDNSKLPSFQYFHMLVYADMNAAHVTYMKGRCSIDLPAIRGKFVASS
jgi:hypothetical protein